jgi:hypothetical protein
MAYQIAQTAKGPIEYRLEGSNPPMGLSFWRTGIIAADTADGAVSLVGSDAPLMACCSRPPAAREIEGILALSYAARLGGG